MKVIIDIPNDFRTDVMTKFQSFFVRVKTEIERQLNFGSALFCGSWEMEEAEMFEKCFSDSVILPDNATNGDVIKAMFPKGKVRREVSCTHDKTVFSFPDGTYFGAECRFNTDWWNESYKGGQEE